ncbi:ATP-dependent helicase [Microlunatus ginsengisoli]|uniref:DNA 3'-5' helicase n=1 Tax=Microlunatus ginsengisoli TaxID=363863 RepID=A0ABP6ZWI9_9ACTN
MTVSTLNPIPVSAILRDEADLCDALRVDFSDEQLAAITAPLDPGVIIAGAGSGKTTVMAARVVWLVGTGAVRPEQVLGLTFTRKAAAELSARIRAALVTAGVVDGRGVDSSGEQVVMTYDAFAGRLVSEHGLRLGFEADPTMISGATRYRLASRVVKAAAGPFDHISRLRPATVTDRVLKLDSDLQQHLVAPDALDPHARDYLLALESAPLNNRGNVYADVKKAMLAAEERLELVSLVRDYQALKQRLGLVEFADQMAIAARLAKEVPQVSAALRDAFSVVLLDEYQDTSAAQAALLRGLFSGRTPDEGLGHPVTAVGDPFQAIYGWRGAAASNIIAFADDFRTRRGRPARQFALTVNRRSGQAILDVANTLSASLRTDTTGLLGGAGTVDGLGLLRAPEGTPSGRVHAAMHRSWPEEVRWIGDRVVAARADGTAPHWADIAVLTRRNADIGALYGELTGRDVPVEIVGLGGLLQLPEIADVLAVLRLIDDVTANPDLVRLLTGPRWRIGVRDLALLGRRARELAHAPRTAGEAAERAEDLLGALEDAVADVDPADLVCLLDALEDPGEADYSAETLRRFRHIAAELDQLRQHSDEPVLDLTRRVIVTLGLDVEVMATPEFVRSGRRDQLGTFLDAVADYVDVDGDASLSGLLAYLQAEIEQGAGLEQAVPSDREAVKLLTVHRAKGLEWPVVFLPALMHGVFPSDRVTDNWVANPAVLPADLRGDAGAVPQLTDASNTAMGAYKTALRSQQLLAEDRLAYVAATRAKRLLVGSGHYWRAELANPRQPSAYLQTIMDAADAENGLDLFAAEPGPVNPLVVQAVPKSWPAPLDPEAASRREQAAAAVEAARRAGGIDPGTYELLLDDAEVVAGWDADLGRLIGELRSSRSGRRTVLLPADLSASAVLRLAEDPERFAAELARPMPRPPSRAARFGTRFHAWVERQFAGRLGVGGLGQQQLIDPDDLPDRADAGADADEDLRELCRAFADGAYGHRVPYAVEAPFSVVVGGRLIRGRIDAVYDLGTEGGDHRYQVVDWKTGRVDSADPLQLAIYRLAWAEVTRTPPDRVDAVFYHVRADRVIRPTGLAERPELEAILAGSVPSVTDRGL